MKKDMHTRCYTWLITLLIMTGIFTCLYLSFITGQYFYGYSDIGSDTVTTYLPNIVFDVDGIANGRMNVYCLQRGLGEFYDGVGYKYFNLVNLPLLMFGEEHLQLGLMVSLYIKYLCICVFSILFFERLLKNRYCASFCALLWTFSGFAVLWGQHYQFLTSMVFFTIALYGIQLFLEGDRKRFLLIPALAGLAYISYFCLYTSCFFFAVYSILYLAFYGAGAKAVLKKAGLFALGLLLAVGIAGESIFPSLMDFFQSSRVSDVTQVNWQGAVYTPDYLFAFLGRLLSNNMLGTGQAYAGPRNYYEVAILSVSVLFIFSLVLLLQSKQWKRVAIIAWAAAAVLCVPYFSQLFGFSYENQRWTYFLCFAEVIVIGLAIRYLFMNRQQAGIVKILRRTIVVADGIYIGCIAVLWLAQRYSAIDLKLNAALLVMAFLVLYSVFFALVPYWGKRWGYAALTALVSLELVVMNYSTVYSRIMVTSEDWYQTMYYDGTGEAVEWIQMQDDSLYRMNKTYHSVGYNDALVQGYYGVEVYNSTNAAELIHLYTSLGYSLQYNTNTNWVRFSAGDDIVNTLLGVKYLIAEPEDEVNEQFYQEIYSDGAHVVYENQFSLGFGYLYPDRISRAEFEAADDQQRRMLLTNSYYLTEETVEDQENIVLDVPGTKMLDYRPYCTGSAECDVISVDSALRVSGTGDDMQLYFDWPDIPEGWSVTALTVTARAEEGSYIQLFVASEDGTFQEEQSVLQEYEAGSVSCRFDVMTFGTPTQLRLDPSMVEQEIIIESVQLQLSEDAVTIENLKTLQSSCMTDFSQEENTFSGTISNPYTDGAMLCVPLIYSDRWTAVVDGDAAEVENINGGLVGIVLESGTHEISITYHDNTQQIGRMVGAGSFTLYLIGTVIWWRRRGRKERPISAVPAQELTEETRPMGDEADSHGASGTDAARPPDASDG